MSSLRQFLVERGAKPATIYEGTEKVQLLVLTINEGSKDRFKTSILYDKAFPNVIFVAKDKLRGLTIVPHSEMLANHNNLHTVAKENYEKLLKDIETTGIKVELNEATYNL